MSGQIKPAVPTPRVSHRASLNVEEELGFYAAYHSNKVNQAIHFVCIPMILWSALIMLAHVPLPFGDTQVHYLAPGMAVRPNLALVVYLGYQAYYFLLEPLAALTFVPIGTVMYMTATAFATFAPLSLPLRTYNGPLHPSAMPFAIALNVASWIAQFIGHGVFEKRAPALFNNLTQALVLAPFFVHLEMLFTFFNYKPELHRKMINAAGKRIRDMNQAAKVK